MALEFKNAEIAAKDAELAAKDAEIARKDAAIVAKDAWLAAKLTAKNCQILQLKYLLLEQFKTILLDQVAPLDQRLKEVEQLHSTPAVFPTDITVASFLRSFGAQRSGFLSRHAHAALRRSYPLSVLAGRPEHVITDLAKADYEGHDGLVDLGMIADSKLEDHLIKKCELSPRHAERIRAEVAKYRLSVKTQKPPEPPMTLHWPERMMVNLDEVLNKAIYHDYVDILQQAHAAGFDVTNIMIFENEEWRALHVATFYESMKCISYLMDIGADQKINIDLFDWPDDLDGYNHDPVVDLIRSKFFNPLQMATLKSGRDAEVTRMLRRKQYFREGFKAFHMSTIKKRIMTVFLCAKRTRYTLGRLPPELLKRVIRYLV